MVCSPFVKYLPFGDNLLSDGTLAPSFTGTLGSSHWQVNLLQPSTVDNFPTLTGFWQAPSYTSWFAYKNRVGFHVPTYSKQFLEAEHWSFIQTSRAELRWWTLAKTPLPRTENRTQGSKVKTNMLSVHRWCLVPPNKPRVWPSQWASAQCRRQDSQPLERNQTSSLPGLINLNLPSKKGIDGHPIRPLNHSCHFYESSCWEGVWLGIIQYGSISICEDKKIYSTNCATASPMLT